MDRKKLALIHIIKRELGLTEEEYRDVLQKTAGVKSAKDLDDFKFRKLMVFLVRSKRYRVNPYGVTLKQKLFIDHLTRELGWDQDHLNHFISKYYRKPNLYAMTRRQAVKLIESLKNVLIHYREK